jgi:hypothetical protein
VVTTSLKSEVVAAAAAREPGPAVAFIKTGTPGLPVITTTRSEVVAARDAGPAVGLFTSATAELPVITSSVRSEVLMSARSEVGTAVVFKTGIAGLPVVTTSSSGSVMIEVVFTTLKSEVVFTTAAPVASTTDAPISTAAVFTTLSTKSQVVFNNSTIAYGHPTT